MAILILALDCLGRCFKLCIFTATNWNYLLHTDMLTPLLQALQKTSPCQRYLYFHHLVQTIFLSLCFCKFVAKLYRRVCDCIIQICLRLHIFSLLSSPFRTVHIAISSSSLLARFFCTPLSQGLVDFHICKSNGQYMMLPAF